MKDLPVAARLYVVAVCVAGAVVAALNAPHSLNKPGMFFVLLVCSLSCVTFGWIVATVIWDDIRERLRSGRRPIPAGNYGRRFTTPPPTKGVDTFG